MPDWLRIVLAVLAGLVLFGGLAAFAFGSMPGRRKDGGLTQHDADRYFHGD